MKAWLIAKIHRLNPTLVLAYALFAVSALILAAVILFTMRVQVLTDWRLVLPAGDIHAGDTVALESLYTKLRPVKGRASRYLECKNSSGVFVKYLLNEAVADNAPGKSGTGIIIKVPDNVPGLPDTCHFSVNIDYQVYPWRTVTEFASTRDFTLLPPVSKETAITQVLVVREDATPLPIQTNQGLAQSTNVGGASGRSSSVNSTPTAQSPQPESSQPASPSILMRITDALSSVL